MFTGRPTVPTNVELIQAGYYERAAGGHEDKSDAETKRGGRSMTDFEAVMRSQGFCVLRSVVTPREITDAKDRCLSEWEKFVANGGRWVGGGMILGHVNYRPPPDLLILGKVVSHSRIKECVDGVLGNGSDLVSIGGNVNLPGSRVQPSHHDGDMDTRYLAINVPLGDVDEANGSLEVFPGTHRERLSYSEFQKRQLARPVRVNTQSGDVIIRHPNVWHRGTANRSGAPRFMLAFSYGPATASPRRLLLSRDNAELLRSSGSKSDIAITTGDGGEFWPNYFGTDIVGYAKEMLCRYTPGVYDLVRRFVEP
jgi:hypothetical protein